MDESIGVNAMNTTQMVTPEMKKTKMYECTIKSEPQIENCMSPIKHKMYTDYKKHIDHKYSKKLMDQQLRLRNSLKSFRS